MKRVSAAIAVAWLLGSALAVTPAGSTPDPYRLVKFSGPVGSRQRERLAAAGYVVVSYHPLNSFLVRPEPGKKLTPLSSLEGVMGTGPFHPYFKLGDGLAGAVRAGDASRFVVTESNWGLRFNVRLHEDDALGVVAAAVATLPGVVRVFPTRTLPIRVQVEPERFVAFLQSAAALPGVVVIEPWLPVKLLNDENVQAGQSGHCVVNGVEAPNTPVFNHGLTGWGARLVVADECVDANSGYWYDDALGQLPPYEPSAPWTSTEPDWSQRKIIEYYDMSSGGTPLGCPTADSDHGTHVAGTMTGNCSLDAEGIATQTNAANRDGDQDGMAPGAHLIVQQLFAETSDLAYLNDSGGTMGELFDVAFENTCLGADCGIDVHSNSWGGWGDYETNAFAGDRSLWKTGRGLIVAAAGNAGEIISPSLAKNITAVGRAYECSVDSVWETSGRGPTADGRLKPDVVAGGTDVTSVNNDGNSDNVNGGCLGDKIGNGTSMAAPTVSGLSALMLQYFNDGFHPSGSATPFDALEPSGPLMKAMLVNTAQRMTDPDNAEQDGVSWPNMVQGWGFVVLENALYFSGDTRKLWVHDETVGVDLTGSASMTFGRKVTGSSEPLKVTLVWYDAPHEGACGAGVPCLDNDLDLTVTEPTSGDSWTTTLVSGTAGQVVPRTVVPHLPVGVGQTTTDNGPDNLNSVEQIIIYNPTPDRVYEFTVTAANTPDGPIPFALVATGALADPCTAPAGAAPITASDSGTCSNGVLVSWGQDVASWNDGGSGTRHYRVWRDGMPIPSGPCAGNLAYGTTSCVDDGGPRDFAADYRVEYMSGCGATIRTAEVTVTDAASFVVQVRPSHPDVCVDTEVVFSAGVDPSGSYSYQWSEDGVDIPSATSSTLALAKGTPQAHTYNCRVTDATTCSNDDLTPAMGTWFDEPANVTFSPQPLTKLCGDGDAFVERGEIWSMGVRLANPTACHAANNTTADVQARFLSQAEVCNPHGEYGDLAPGAYATEIFVFKMANTAGCTGTMVFDVENIAWDGGSSPDGYFFLSLAGECNLTACPTCSALVAGEVSPVGATPPLTIARNGSLVDLTFKAVSGATRYNVYVSTEASTLPFLVTDPAVGKKSCAVPWQSQLGKVVSNGFDVEAGIAPGKPIYYILVTADKGFAMTEGALGFTSDATEREADSRCAD